MGRVVLPLWNLFQCPKYPKSQFHSGGDNGVECFPEMCFHVPKTKNPNFTRGEGNVSFSKKFYKSKKSKITILFLKFVPKAKKNPNFVFGVCVGGKRRRMGTGCLCLSKGPFTLRESESVSQKVQRTIRKDDSVSGKHQGKCSLSLSLLSSVNGAKV